MFKGGLVSNSPDRVLEDEQRRVDMKNVVIAMLLVFGVSVTGSVFACDGSSHDKSKAGTSAPATPAPAPVK